jgi:acyl carrier protein
MDPKAVNGNRQQLKELLTEILLLEDQEFRFDLGRDEVETWDSLAVVAIAAGIEETFGYHFTPEEATSVTGVPAIITILERNQISFTEA